MFRIARLRSLALALTTATAGGALVACKSDPPQIVVHTDKSDRVDPGQMTVTGTATIQISPDCADLTMTLTGDAMRPGAAVDKVTAQEKVLVASLKKLGLEEADLKLSTLGIEPVYEWIGNSNVFKGYAARITLTATTRRFELIASIMEAGADAGVKQMSSQFRRSDLDELKAQVREKALVAARTKAKQTADVLGIHLGRVAAVSEGSSSYLYANAYFPAARVANVTEAIDNSSPVALGAELQPLTIDVTVSYQLGDEA